jgi:SAM-dependent methyltransferase
MSVDAAEKYDRIADGFAERSWANLEFDMPHRFDISTTWGLPLRSGNSVVELGCGDGFLAQLFIQHGLFYCGLDISPRMVLMAQRRLAAAGTQARFNVGNAAQFSLNESVDAIVSFMGAFFTFIDDPLPLLRRLRPHIRKKIILDLNPRGPISLPDALEMLRAAGFVKTAWRPIFMPMTVKLPEPILRTLTLCENVPGLCRLPLRWRFDSLLKGETTDGGNTGS